MIYFEIGCKDTEHYW